MKYGKILALGLAALISSNALAAPNLGDNPAIHQLTEKVQMMQKAQVMPPVDVNIVLKPKAEILEDVNLAFASLDIAKQSCVVEMNVSPEGVMGKLSTPEMVDKFSGLLHFENQKQEELQTEFVLIHEMSHCKLYGIASPFRSSDPIVQELMNKYYQYADNQIGLNDKPVASPYYVLHENFADTMAAIQLLRNHGPTKDVLTTLQKIQISRSELAVSGKEEYGFDSHHSNFSLEELLTKDNIKKVLKTDNQQELIEIALNIANKGMWKSIKTHSSFEEVISAQSLEDGALSIASVLAREGITESNGNPDSNVQLKEDNNVLFKIGKEVAKELKEQIIAKGLTSDEEIDSFFSENETQIRDSVAQKLDKEITVEYEKYGKTHYEILQEHGNIIKKESVKTLSEIKDEAIDNINKAKKLAASFNANSAIQLTMGSVMKNLDKIRNTSTNTPSVKVGSVTIKGLGSN